MLGEFACFFLNIGVCQKRAAEEEEEEEGNPCTLKETLESHLLPK